MKKKKRNLRRYCDAKIWQNSLEKVRSYESISSDGMSLSLIEPGIILYCLHEINFTISESNYVRAAQTGKQIMDSEMTPPFLLPSLYKCVYSYFIFFFK